MAHRHAPGGGHGHAHATGATRGPLLVALVLNLAFTACEAVAGFWAGSLALLADAGHNLSDVVALAIAYGASVLAARPPTPRRSFGFRRAEILAAFVNALTLVVVAVWVAVEAIRRFGETQEVNGGWVIAVAAIGIAVNLGGAAVLMRGAATNLNVRAAFVHLAGDAAGSVLVIVAGVLIAAFAWTVADPITGLVLAFLILASAWGVLRDSTRILMEQTPPGRDVEEIGRAILSVPGVRSYHDLHVWAIDSGFDALSAHVLVAAGEDCHACRQQVEVALRDRFGLTHTTLQVDHAREELLRIEPV
ncbi:MAG: cation diffusion facilitator family transporter, partial [Gaiella sp.]